MRADPVASYDATSTYSAASGLGDEEPGDFDPRLLVERANGHESGSAYEIPNQGATLGRGDVEIRLDDPFASAHHARISREGHVVVPRSDTLLDVGDEVLLLVSAQCADDEIRTLLLRDS